MRIIFTVLLILLSFSTVLGQVRTEKLYLRHSMIFYPGETPRISPSNMLFTEQSICGFSSAPYDSQILRRGDEVELISEDRDSKPAKVKFKSQDREFEIELSNASKRAYRSSFDLAFSGKKRDFGYGALRTWADLIKEYGFPAAKCKDNGGWFYFLEFSPACGSFDGCVFRLTDQGFQVYGYV